MIRRTYCGIVVWLNKGNSLPSHIADGQLDTNVLRSIGPSSEKHYRRVITPA